MSIYVIAEAGVNHNGSFELAKKLVDAAKDAGADCVKFQTFKASNLVSKDAQQAEYQKKNTNSSGSQFEMLKKLELTYNEFRELSKYCHFKEIEFMSTAFDFDSIDFLYELDMKKWKIPSGDITNLPYLIKIAELGKPIILSTGMSTMEEIDNALEVFKQYNADDVTVLHCTTEYPAPLDEVNLKAMLSIQERFNVAVGYSDHTEGIEIPIAATALGATVIEKHFTLDRNMEGPDHKASLEPQELKEMISAIKNVSYALGDGIKRPVKSELKNIEIARKSIIATKHIKQGEVFTDENLTVKRPGNGISPMLWFEVIGQVASKDFDEDELITL